MRSYISIFLSFALGFGLSSFFNTPQIKEKVKKVFIKQEVIKELPPKIIIKKEQDKCTLEKLENLQKENKKLKQRIAQLEYQAKLFENKPVLDIKKEDKIIVDENLDLLKLQDQTKQKEEKLSIVPKVIYDKEKNNKGLHIELKTKF